MGHFENQDIGKFSLRVNCEPLDWQIDSATQVCTALGKILSIVEELTLDLDADEMPSDWEDALDNMLGHELLLPFIGVKKLHIGRSLVLEVSQALHSVPGELALELLPELQELEVEPEINYAKNLAKNPFSGFVKTRESVGRPVQTVKLVKRANLPLQVTSSGPVSRKLHPDMLGLCHLLITRISLSALSERPIHWQAPA